jgi:hypothetical protein
MEVIETGGPRAEPAVMADNPGDNDAS